LIAFGQNQCQPLFFIIIRNSAGPVLIFRIQDSRKGGKNQHKNRKNKLKAPQPVLKFYLLKLTGFVVMLSREAKHLALAEEKPSVQGPDSSLHFVSLRMTMDYILLQIKELQLLMPSNQSV